MRVWMHECGSFSAGQDGGAGSVLRRLRAGIRVGFVGEEGEGGECMGSQGDEREVVYVCEY